MTFSGRFANQIPKYCVFHRNFDCWPILGVYYAKIDQKCDYVLTEGSGREIYFRILLVLIDDFPVSEEIDCTSGINPV